MRQFLWGALAMSSAVASVFFLRYWRIARERLFIYFSVAFAALTLNWVGLSIADPSLETRHHLYLLRLAAFVLIIVGIVEKNRPGNHP